MAVDLFTIALGSRGVYLTKKAKYLRMGMSEEAAEKRAIQDAEICYNKSQQSSEGPWIAPIQADRTVIANAVTIFRSSNISYTREAHASARNLLNMTRGKVSEEYMAKQNMRLLGIDPENASEEQREAAMREAKRDMQMAWVRNGVNLLMFGWGLGLLWRLINHAHSSLFGGDDDDKKKTLEEDLSHGVLGPLEG